MKAKRKEKKKYNSISNILWALRRMWQMDLKFCLSFFVVIPTSILASLAGNYFPKVLIDTLGANEPFSRVAAIIDELG